MKWKNEATHSKSKGKAACYSSPFSPLSPSACPSSFWSVAIWNPTLQALWDILVTAALPIPGFPTYLSVDPPNREEDVMYLSQLLWARVRF